MNLWLSITTVGFLCLIPPAKSETLEDAIIAMLRFEPGLMAVDSDSRSTFEEYKIAKAELRPRIGISSDSGYATRDRSTDAVITNGSGDLYSRNIGLSIRQLLYDGGVNSLRSTAAKEAYYAQRLLQMGVIEDRVVDLVEVYLELLRLDEQLKEACDNIDYHRNFLRKLSRHEELGGSRSDTLLIDGRLSMAESARTEILLSRDTAASRFRRLTGGNPCRLVRPAAPQLNRTPGTIDLAGNWHYLAACATYDSALSEMQAEKANRKPNVYLDAGATEGYDTLGVKGRDREVHALVGVQWDLYRGGMRKAFAGREKWQAEKARNLVIAADENRSQKARDFLAEYRRANECRLSVEKYVHRLELVANDYEKQFQLGNRELMNLLSVENELFQARLKLIDSQYNEFVNIYRIWGVQGKLVTTLTGREILKIVGTGCKEKDEWYDHTLEQVTDCQSTGEPVSRTGIFKSGSCKTCSLKNDDPNAPWVSCSKIANAIPTQTRRRFSRRK
ncbi:MAG: TolC family protein [Verrucomicrobiales bacterium]|nr:TolC family protein [Verrucomicrobiales bacterium]